MDQTLISKMLSILHTKFRQYHFASLYILLVGRFGHRRRRRLKNARRACVGYNFSTVCARRPPAT